MAIIDTNALAAALGETTAPDAPAPPAAAPQAAPVPVPAPKPSAAGGFDPTALRAALAAASAPAAAASAPAETIEQALAREAEEKRLRDIEANRAELEMYARTANHYLKGISPEVMSTVRRISREDGIPLPLAAQNYGLAIQKRSEEEFAAFSQAEPSFGKLASLVYQYPDLAGEGASLSTVLVAARKAFNRPEEEDLTTATQDVTAGILAFSAGMTALGAALDEKSIQSLDQSAAYLQSIIPEWEQLSGRYAEIDALLAQGDALSPEEQEALLTEQQDVAGRLALTNFGIGRGSPKDALARTIEDKQQAYRDVGTKLVQSLAASAAAADIPMNPAAARLATSTTLEAALTEAFADPAGVIRSLGLRSLPSMAPPIIAGAAGGLIAGPVGAAALAGLAGASVEMGATIQEGLQTELIAAGVDVTDPDAVTAWAQENTEAFAAIVQKATARAAVIAAFDAGIGGLGAAIARATRGASTATRIATKVAVDTGLQGVGEVVGSAAAQLVTEGTLPTVGESLSELIAGTAMGAPSAALTLGADVLRETIQSEGGVKAVNNLVKEQLEQRQVAAEAVTTDLQIARAAVEEAKVFATDPETVRTLLETDDDGDVYIPASEVNRLYQEGALTDEDLQYLNVEQELIQQGELSGDVVIKRSALLTTKAEAFTALADHVRVTPDGTTAAEARANVANLEGEAARLESKMIQLINVEAEIDGLATQIYDSIPASPQVSRRQRQAVSRLMAQRYATRAALFGPEVTAQSLYEADQLTFQQQGAGQAAAGVRAALEQDEFPDLNAEGQPVEAGVDVPESIDALATIDAANMLSQGQSWQTGRDLKLALQDRLRTASAVTGADLSQRTAANTAYLIRVGVKDARIALAQNPNAIGWYDEKTRQALAVMALTHPEIAKDPNARFAFTWALAVTSNGLKVGKNFELADRVYRTYKETGRMPSNLTAGQAQIAINDSLELFNQLADEWGMDTLRRFMQTNFTVREIGSISESLKPSGEAADTVVRGSAILGPKIGNGFFSNLYGNFDALTMDRWLVRTWGRWTGTLIMLNEPQIVASRTRLRAALTGVNAQELSASLNSVVKTATNKKTGVTTSTAIKPKDRDNLLAAFDAALAEDATDQQIDDLSSAIAKVSMEPKLRKAMNDIAGGEELRKAGNSLAKYNDGQKEAPSGPPERTYIREVFTGMLEELRQDPRYADLQMADLQAVLWYAEKRLYETAKEDVVITGDDVVGYEDEDAPDYANAAAAVARANGVPETKIKAALKRESKDGRAAAARRSDAGDQIGGGQQTEAGGFTRSEKREFIQTRAIHRVRSSRRGDAAAWSYGRKGEGDGGKVRLLKGLGVRYLEVWKAGRSLANTFRTNGIATPEFYELATGSTENAVAFADAIRAGRDTLGDMGKAVTVYPPEAYVDLRLFLTKDGKAGFAIKPDGDIVSVFSSAGTGAGRAILETAISAGGRKLDAFHTILPSFYSVHGFKAAARILWDDNETPEGWDKRAFADYNNGEPDVVFMVYDPEHFSGYDPKATPLKKGDNNYGAALRAQDKAMRAVTAAEATRQQAGERLILNQGENDGEVRSEQTRDGGGRYTAGGLAPLEGAPNVTGAFGPDPQLIAVAEAYARDNGIDLARQAEYVEVDVDRAKRIAAAFTAMPHAPQDPAVKEAYAALIEQTTAQYQALVDAGYVFTFFDDATDPYDGNPWNAMRDLRANKRMAVYATSAGFGTEGVTMGATDNNPLLVETGIFWKDQSGVDQPVTANDLFRAVHDAFGHGLEGAGFRARGEENAWQAHVRLFTGSAVAAVTTGTRGQNSWLNYGPLGEANQTAKVSDTTFADQKIGLLPSWVWEEGKAGDMPTVTALEQSRPTGPQTNDKGAVGAPRGSYVPPTSMDPRNLINLTTTADVTTFVHESGHMFLFQMMQDLADPRLTPEGRATLTKQIDSMRGWFGRNADQGLADLKRMSESATKRAASMPMGAERDQATLRAMRLTGAYNRAVQNGGPAYMQRVAAAFMDPTAVGHDEAAEVVFHELWARGFEQYMGTGTAPTSELAKLFAQFSKFITTIYQSLRRLNVEITPEITDVFDRLLAGEEALQAERSGSIYQVPDAVFASATPAEAKRLRELAAEAEAEASIMMQSRIASSLRAEEVNKRNARREQLMVEVTEQVQNEPVYTAITIARTGVTPNGDKKIGSDPLNYAEVAAFAGEQIIPSLPKGVVSGKSAKAGNPISLGMLRDLAGYDSTDAMLLAMSAPDLEGQQARIKRLVEERMTAEFGDEKDMSRFKDRAIEIAQNDKFQQLQVLLVRVLRRMAASDMATVAERQTERRGAPSAREDVAAGAAADTALAAATKPQDVVQAGLQKIRAEVQKKANVKGRRAQRAASLTTATIRRGIDPEAIKLAALRFVGKAKVGDMTPLRYRQAAQRLTIKIEQAIATRNYTEAAALMEQRAMNFAVAEQAAIVQGKVDSKRTYWSTRLNRTDKRLAASYDMDHVNTIRALMQPFGFAREASRNYNARAALSALSTTEPALYKEMMAALTQYAQISQRAQQTHPKDPIKGLTVLEFEELLDLADRLLAGARDSKGILINGERIAFEQIGAEVAANVQQRRKVQKAARSRRAGRGGKTMRMVSRSLNGFKAMLRRIELWAKDIDNGNPTGPVTQYLVRPVMEAVDTYMAKRQEPQRQLLSLLRGRSDLQARRPIAAPELGGYTFQTKGELLMAILHTGNDSNKRKLLLGGAVDVATGETYVWGSENKDGTLDTSRWDTFFQRMIDEGQITKADMDLAQGIWDLFETTKSAAQEAHKRMYGYYFAEIEATPLDTPFGVYKGGYAPAITDKMMSPDGDRHEAEEVMSQQANAAMFPAAEKGFTISRVAGGIGPLDLDMSRIPSHLDRVMKFAHLGPAVRNAARLVKNRAFSDAIRVASPDVIDVAVIPWLQRTVQQRVTTQPTNRGWNGVDKIAQAINNRVGLHLMAGNILNAAQQVTGFSVAAAVVPVRHLAAAFTTFRVNGQGARAHILSRSTFMAERLTDGANEVATTLENYLSEPSMLSAPRRAAERVGYFAQQLAQNLIDPTVWLAAERHGMTTVYPDVYAAELEKTGDEAAADAAATKAVVFYADSVVRQTQAPIRASDISAIEASSPMARLFLKFYSYFNAMGNLLVTQRSIAQNSQLGWTSRQGRAFYAYLMIVAVPSIVAESMSQLAKGNADELEEDEIDQLMFEIIVGSQIKTTLAMVPYVGQAGGLVYGVAATDTVNDDKLSMPAGLSVLSGTLSSLTKLIMVAADPDTDVDTKKAIKTTLDAFALASGIPTNWLSKPLQYAADVHEGKASPQGLTDLLQGALTGKDGTAD